MGEATASQHSTAVAKWKGGKWESEREGKICARTIEMLQDQPARLAVRLQQILKKTKKALHAGHVPGECDLVCLGCLKC